MIQRTLAESVHAGIRRAQEAGSLPPIEAVPAVEMERPARKEHGDWATNVALALAKAARMKPREVAEAIVRHLDELEHVAKVEIAGPGFINFALSHSWLHGVVREVLEGEHEWGRTQAEHPQKIQVEFVSANPTGPMHLGHGRWAAVGDAIARLLEWTGHTVEREFYVNDFGGQMEKFGRSIAARYLQLLGREAEIPDGGYHGAYITDIAKEIIVEIGERSLEEPDEERVEFMRVEGQRRMLVRQREALHIFGVEFDVWFSERSLHDDGAVARVVELLAERGHTFEADGALWLRTTAFGDDKDRVLVRSNGIPTYLAPDIAYYVDKIRRGFQRILYLWGADHHGHVRQLRAGITALGEDPEHAEFLLGQFVHLVRGGEVVKMSKRTGEAITFDELLEEVGTDAARYHFLRTSMDQTLTFDVDLVTSQTQENPVFYVQYAHARIASILRHAADQGIEPAPLDQTDLGVLEHPSELDLLRKIAELPEALEVAARLRAPHRIPRYAEDLAALFHAFYRDCRVVGEDPAVTQARLHLARAAQVALRNALAVIGVSAPESM